MRVLWVALIAAGILSGQTFEVASVKPTPPPGTDRAHGREIHGGPGSTDPGAIHFTSMDLFSLVNMAYDIASYQLSGPDWMKTARFDITAKLPAGTTIADYRAMLRNLLVERFQLQAHREQKEVRGFDLVVAKGGPKLTKSASDFVPKDWDGALQPPPSPPQVPQGYKGEMIFNLRNCTMDSLARRLSGMLNQPIANSTGLDGAYDIVLRYTAAGLQPETTSADGDSPTPRDAIESQLGLKLTAKKQTIELLVIDRIEKAPIEN